MNGRISKLTLAMIAAGLMSTSFGATSLLTVYNQAQKNDTDFQNAEATYQSAKQAMPLAMANLLPQVAGTAGYQKANTGSYPSHYWMKTWGATLSQTLFDWSAFAGISKAKASIRGALATYEAAKQTLISNTISAYLTVVQDAATVEYDHAYTNQLSELLKQQQQKYKVGIIPITDVYQAQSEYDTQLATNISDKNTLNSDIESLRAITNHGYSSIKGVSTGLPLHTPRPASMSAWVQSALQNNLGIIGAKALVDVDKATVNVDHGAHLPSLSVTGSYQQTHSTNRIINNKSKNPNVSSVGLSLNVPIFSGGSMFAQTRQDKFTQEADQANLDGTTRNTIANTRSSYMAVDAAISGVRAAKQAYISASQSLKATRAGYQVGTNTIVNVLTDMSNRIQAQQSIVTNQVAYLNAIVALKAEAGSLNDRDVKAISKILNKTVHLPDTLSDMQGAPTNNGHQAMTDAQKATKVNSGATSTTEQTTQTAINHIQPDSQASATNANSHSSDAPYSIQLFVSNSQTRANKFIADYLNNNSSAYVTQHVDNGKTYYIVMYGHYTSATDAADKITQLPTAVQRLKPWVKKVG